MEVNKKYHVTIIRTIKTVVEVEADTAHQANQNVKGYGLIEAVSDYRVISEDASIRVSKVVEEG